MLMYFGVYLSLFERAQFQAGIHVKLNAILRGMGRDKRKKISFETPSDSWTLNSKQEHSRIVWVCLGVCILIFIFNF